MKEQPNIVFVVCDDLAWGDLSAHGNPHVQTPNLDALRKQSRRFVGYRSGPLCTPARSSIMTGRHHLRTAAIDTYLGRTTLRPDERTLPELLRGAGYSTAMFGKWHLGDYYPCRPEDRGFDEAIWHPSGAIGQPGDLPGNTYFDPSFLHNGQRESFTGYCTDIFVDRAIDRLKTSREQPAFVYIAPNCPHTPLQVPESWVAPFRAAGVNETHARVYAMVKNLDQAIGRLIRTVQTEVDRPTIVVFTSDHGPCNSSRHGTEVRYNDGLRGEKATLYEGGIRVPCLMHWAGQIAPGDDDRLASPMDWLPTFAGITGFALPEDRVIDGRDLLDPSPDPERALIMQWHRGDAPIRHRNFAVIRGDWKLYQPCEDRPVELYRLPDESGNLADAEPDRVRDLGAIYETFFDHLTDEHGDATFDPVPLVLGEAAAPEAVLSWQDWRVYAKDREGWSFENPGWWPVDIRSDQRFTIDVDLTGLPVKTGSLTLTCGAWRAEVELIGPFTHRFDDVRLPTGRHRFEALVRSGDRTLGVRQVLIRSAAPSTPR